MNKIWEVCLDTGEKFDTCRGFLNHLRKLKLSSKDYYDKHHKKLNEGICYCGKETRYHGFAYKEFCSDKCAMRSEKHRESVRTRFIKNPDALENFRRLRAATPISMDKEKRTKTITLKAEKLGMTLEEYYSDHSKKASATISPERRLLITQKGMDTRSKTGKMGGRSYYKDFDLFGEIIRVQGYEPQVLKFLVEDIGLQKHQIVAGGKKNVPSIDYRDVDGTPRKYYPDIFLPEQKLLIEVKSDYTYEKHQTNTHQKAKGCLEAGYSIFVLVLSSNKMRKHGLEGYKKLLDWAISSRASKPTWYGAGSTTIPEGSRE